MYLISFIKEQGLSPLGLRGVGMQCTAAVGSARKSTSLSHGICKSEPLQDRTVDFFSIPAEKMKNLYCTDSPEVAAARPGTSTRTLGESAQGDSHAG